MEELIIFILEHEAGLKVGRCAGMSMEQKFEQAKKTGWANDKDDPGGATQCGITIGTYRGWCRSAGLPVPSTAQLRNITFAHWLAVFRSLFWDLCRADDIQCTPVAWLLVDWVWASGPKVIREFQALLGVKADGKIGPVTIAAANATNGQELFDKLFAARQAYISKCVARNARLKKFERGWRNRLNRITFARLKYE